MKSDELTPEALLKFFSELESGGTDEECELHYGCGCVIGKGLKAAQMLVAVQKALGVESPKPAAAKEPAAGAGAVPSAEAAQMLEFEAALMAPGFPKTAAATGPDPETQARLSEAEGEIDRLLVQTVDLKAENKKLREKIKDLYKQIERLYTRSEMSKLLGTLDEKIAREAQAEAEATAQGGEGGEDGEAPEPEEAGEAEEAAAGAPEEAAGEEAAGAEAGEAAEAGATADGPEAGEETPALENEKG